MALSDLVKGGGKPAAAIAIKVAPADTMDAAARLLKAFEDKDVHAIDDALHMWTSAFHEHMDREDPEEE